MTISTRAKDWQMKVEWFLTPKVLRTIARGCLVLATPGGGCGNFRCSECITNQSSAQTRPGSPQKRCGNPGLWYVTPSA